MPVVVQQLAEVEKTQLAAQFDDYYVIKASQSKI